MDTLEKNKLKYYHIIYAIFIVPFCIFISITSFWGGYSTLTERPGYHGYVYHYYNVSKEFYYIYNFAISLILIHFLCFILKYLYERNGDKLMNTYWLFLVFVLIITYCEYLLELRFIPKG